MVVANESILLKSVTGMLIASMLYLALCRELKPRVSSLN